MDEEYRYLVYTDGGASPNPGIGGYGTVIIDQKTGEVREFSAGYRLTTNNRMELSAVLRALRELPDTDENILILADSQWVIGCASKGWKRNKNRDLWQIYDKLKEKKQVRFDWVKGHAGEQYNERCDELANEAKQSGELLTDEGYA